MVFIAIVAWQLSLVIHGSEIVLNDALTLLNTYCIYINQPLECWHWTRLFFIAETWTLIFDVQDWGNQGFGQVVGGVEETMHHNSLKLRHSDLYVHCNFRKASLPAVPMCRDARRPRTPTPPGIRWAPYHICALVAAVRCNWVVRLWWLQVSSDSSNQFQRPGFRSGDRNFTEQFWASELWDLWEVLDTTV